MQESLTSLLNVFLNNNTFWHTSIYTGFRGASWLFKQASAGYTLCITIPILSHKLHSTEYPSCVTWLGCCHFVSRDLSCCGSGGHVSGLVVSGLRLSHIQFYYVYSNNMLWTLCTHVQPGAEAQRLTRTYYTVLCKTLVQLSHK